MEVPNTNAVVNFYQRHRKQQTTAFKKLLRPLFTGQAFEFVKKYPSKCMK